jgi:amidohydrolase
LLAAAERKKVIHYKGHKGAQRNRNVLLFAFVLLGDLCGKEVFMLLKAQAIQDQLTAWRRDFHMHPELGFHETRTAARVAEICEAMGCRVRREVGRTGVVADLGSGSPRIAIRADMDALPIQEADDRPYCSQHPGKMHACGHDAHTAIALGVALLLSREQFPGSVRFLFQPSEEVGDEEGISGAPRMIADGALDGVNMVLALHVDPATAVGDICAEAGPSSGGVDSWFAAVIGKGCHGAFPHRGGAGGRAGQTAGQLGQRRDEATGDCPAAGEGARSGGHRADDGR